MSIKITHEQLFARDEQGGRHAVMVTRVPVPGSAHLHGPPHYTWRDGHTLHLVDTQTGILECPLTGQHLRIEDWRG